MAQIPKPQSRVRRIRRAFTEIAFIVFLFYANLLMGDFTSTNGRGRSLMSALRDIVTPTNCIIAVFAAVIGYVGFEYLRDKI